MTDSSNKPEKSKLEQDLETMPPEQLATVASMVEAEKLRRDQGASEAEFRKKIVGMSDHERREFTYNQFGYSPKA